jgi:hypothetical protein
MFPRPAQNGWPSVTSEGVQPNSPNAVASVGSEHVSTLHHQSDMSTGENLTLCYKAYFSLLDQHCNDLKNVVGGGVGWFAHIYSDDQEPGYGIYDSSGKLKFPFAPRTSC